MTELHILFNAEPINPSRASTECPDSMTSCADGDGISVLSASTNRESLDHSGHDTGNNIQLEEYRSPSSKMEPVPQSGPHSGGDPPSTDGVDAEIVTETGGECIEACCNCLGWLCKCLCSMICPSGDCDD
jgi:hypothetical protein